MAFQAEPGRQIAAASSILGNLPDDINYEGCPPNDVIVKWIRTFGRLRQAAYSPTDRSCARAWLCELRECFPTSYQNHSTSSLWRTKVDRVEDINAGLVTRYFKAMENVICAPIFRQSWNVLHHERARASEFYKAQKLEDEVIHGVYNFNSTVLRPHGGEALTWWTSHQKI